MVSLALNARQVSASRSGKLDSSCSSASLLRTSLTPWIACWQIPSFQCTSPGIISRNSWCWSQKVEISWLLKAPSGSRRRVSGKPKYSVQASLKLEINWAAETCFCLPVRTCRQTLNREPSSIIKMNWKCSPLLRCTQCPMSAATVEKRAGCGSKDDRFLGWGLDLSWHMGHWKFLASWRTCSGAPRNFNARYKCLGSPCPVAEWRRYNFLRTCSKSFLPTATKLSECSPEKPNKSEVCWWVQKPHLICAPCRFPSWHWQTKPMPNSLGWLKCPSSSLWMVWRSLPWMMAWHTRCASFLV